MRRLFAILCGLLVAVAQLVPVVAAPALDKDEQPNIIQLPNGFRPEGIVIGRNRTIYAGSLGSGAIYGADLRTGQGALVVPAQSGRIAVGLSYDKRTNYIFVAGGPGGAGYVYDAGTGASVGVFPFTSEPNFVNDVIVTKDAAYFTDSFRPFLYRVPLGKDGQLPDAAAVTALPLGGDYVFVPGGFNANGIEATRNGKALVIVNSTEGKLYRVDPNSGNAKLIDLKGGAVPAGDGLLLVDDETLYVVQNQLNQVAVIKLGDKLASGKIVATLTDPALRIPTTIAQADDGLYVINARFDTPPTPDTAYEIVRLENED